MKILFVNDNLNIGVSQLHMTSLAASLKERGEEVLVASDSGVLEKKLCQHDIVHIDLPFSKSKDICQLKLSKIIKEHKPDIVHAFSITTMQILGILKKVLKFNYVSTLFECADGLSRGVFGSRVFSLNSQTENYLIENYSVTKQNIINVCDMVEDTMPSNAEVASLMSAFDLEVGKKRIVYYDNLDEDNTTVAHALIESAIELRGLDSAIEIVIAGNGSDMDSLTTKVATQNARAGEKFIKLIGEGADMLSLISVSDIYVGSGRGALYSAILKKPMIIADEKGYEGIVDENSLERLISLNFVSDSNQRIFKSRMFADLKNLIFMQKSALDTQLDKSYDMVSKKYSGANLTQKTLNVYNNLMQNGERYYDAVLSGYYGHKNSGDDALLSAIIHEIREEKEDARFVVLSNNPAETKKVYGVDAVNRFNIFEVYRAIKRSKLFINGGGSLIQDVTSSKSLYYYLFIIKLALKLKKKTMLYANGIGPVLRRKNRTLASEVINKADVITLRDERSLKVLEDMNVTIPKVKVTSDPSVSITPYGLDRVKEIFINERIEEKPYFVISIREWKNKNIAQEVATAADYISKKYSLTPIFIPMHNPNDISISLDCIKLMTRKAYILKGDYSFTDVMTIASKSTLVLGMRLHLLMYGANMAVPVIGLVYDPKITAYLEYLKQKYIIDTRFVSAEKICNMVDDIFKNYKQISNDLAETVEKLKELSKENAKEAVKLINGEDE